MTSENYLKKIRPKYKSVKVCCGAGNLQEVTLLELLDGFLAANKIEHAHKEDATIKMIDEIISWEKDLSEYHSLEHILRQKYIISERVGG